MLTQLEDLRARLVKDAEQLEFMARQVLGPNAVKEGARISGKAEGVRLALSKLDELLRAES